MSGSCLLSQAVTITMSGLKQLRGFDVKGR